MKVWTITGRETTPVEISDEYAAERFVAWLFKAGRAELEHTLKTFAHAPWRDGGLGASFLEGPEDLDAFARVVRERWHPLTAGEAAAK
ncbi:hypothetical protein AB0C27_06415 [Nonomuraea sp. NPDC048882]|uniref:hypothetical protein n=1 Tax=Nonomuraea sp. NPDC048882 TaxID=3154347 RepID=UPI0033ECF40E